MAMQFRPQLPTLPNIVHGGTPRVQPDVPRLVGNVPAPAAAGGRAPPAGRRDMSRGGGRIP